MGCAASVDATPAPRGGVGQSQSLTLVDVEHFSTERDAPITIKNGALEGQYEGEYIRMAAAHPLGHNGIIRTLQPHGKGRFTYTDGSTYTGYWKRALRHGMGIWRCTDGVEITSEWSEDIPIGIVEFWRENRGGGSYLWRKGTANQDAQLHGNAEDCFELDPFARTRIECVFVNGVAHGPGRMLNRVGRVIREGDWINGQAPPLKEIRRVDYPDGSRYDGDCKDQGHTLDKILRPIPHGRGRLRYWPGDKREEYSGEWWEGLFHGQGTLVMRNGEKYEGQFEYGQEHGMGILSDRQGTVLRQGEWREGSKFDALPSSAPREPRPMPVIERPSLDALAPGGPAVMFPFRQTSKQLPPLSPQEEKYAFNSEEPPPPYEP